MEDDKYKIPAELDEIMEESQAAEEAMKTAVKGFFKYQLRNAITLGKISRKKSHEFWAGVYDLYPELEGKKLTYNSISKTLSVI
jgi:hypothetical protein